MLVSKYILVLYVLATTAGLIVLKLGSSEGAPVALSSGRLVFNINILNTLGLMLYLFSFICYSYIISKYDLGYIIPLAGSFVYIVMFFASFIIFKEKFTILKIAGISLIIIGISLLNIKSQ